MRAIPPELGNGAGDDLEALPLGLERLAPDGPVALEVGRGDDPAAALHLGHDQLGGAPGVESGRAGRRDPLQRRLEFRLPRELAARQRAEVVPEVGTAVQLDHAPVAVPDQSGRDREAVVRQCDRRRHVGRPAQVPEALVELPQALDRPRHARRPRADRAGVLDHVAGGVEVHVDAGRRWRGFPIVEEVGLVLEVHGRESAAAEVAGLGVGDRERKCGRDGGIDRIAALGEDLRGGVGTVDVRGGDSGGSAVRSQQAGEASREHRRGRSDTKSVERHGIGRPGPGAHLIRSA